MRENFAVLFVALCMWSFARYAGYSLVKLISIILARRVLAGGKTTPAADRITELIDLPTRVEDIGDELLLIVQKIENLEDDVCKISGHVAGPGPCCLRCTERIAPPMNGEAPL